MKDLNNNQLEKFEYGDCGCYFWVKDRNDFECPNCKEAQDYKDQKRCDLRS